MPKRSLSAGSDAACDVRLLRPGVAPRHVELSWQDGLVLRDLGAGETPVDGRAVLPNQVVPLTGFHAKVVLGSARLDLTHPALSALVLERTAAPLGTCGFTAVAGPPPPRPSHAGSVRGPLFK